MITSDNVQQKRLLNLLIEITGVVPLLDQLHGLVEKVLLQSEKLNMFKNLNKNCKKIKKK
jgi:hypothetical protein